MFGGTPFYWTMSRKAAMFVAKILEDANPGDLPIEQPTELDFVINLNTARALGLGIQQSVLSRVTETFQ
jgi:putative ABC transport system substrate-binding protein